jgi:integrase
MKLDFAILADSASVDRGKIHITGGGITRIGVLRVARDEHERGTLARDERRTVCEYLEWWLENSVRKSVRPRTYESYADLARRHLMPALGKTRLAKLAPQQIQQLVNEKRTSGLSPRTVHYLYSVLHHALEQAQLWGLVSRNVARLVRLPRMTRPKVRAFNPAQARIFLQAIRGNRLEALYTIALACGVRQGEALALQWEDVDLDGVTVTVRHTLVRIDGKRVLAEPKTEQSYRTIPLASVALESLRAHLLRQAEEQERVGARWQESGFVFTTKRGTPLDAKNVTHRFQAVVDRAGLPHQRFHGLRHSCASLLLAQGLNLKDVSETLGHSRIAVTADLYGHMYDERRREIADRMDAILLGTT